ncbi:MAG: hypothetical protein KDJ82_16210 [Rhodobacteraceae bacterium]|nr:hypothetical protein [Paracoccaceae bacterium]
MADGFEPVGAVPARIVSQAEIARKLAMISRLSAEELRGWVWARKFDRRAPFEGEIAALAARARILGIAL